MTELNPLKELCSLLGDVASSADAAVRQQGIGKQNPDEQKVRDSLSRTGSSSQASFKSQAEGQKTGSAHGRAVEAIRKKYRKQRMTLLKNSSLSVVSTVSNGLLAIHKNYEGMGAAVKAALIAEASMKTMAAANDAYNKGSSLPKPFGLVAGPAAAAIALASGAGTVAQITARKFEQGGPVNPGQGSMGGILAELEGGEYVIPRSTVSEIGGVSGVQAMLGEGSPEDQEPDLMPVLNIRIAGDAHPGTGDDLRSQVRQGLAACGRP